MARYEHGVSDESRFNRSGSSRSNSTCKGILQTEEGIVAVYRVQRVARSFYSRGATIVGLRSLSHATLRWHADRTTPKPRISVPELDFRLVENEADRLQFCDINADSYGFSSEWRDDVARWTSQWPSETVRLYLAYNGNEAVSSAMVYLTGDVTYLGFVATRQRHQKGIRRGDCKVCNRCGR